MSTPSYNEQTSAWVNFAYYDRDGAESVPATLSYRIDCLTTDTQIRADTAITPAVQTGDIHILPADTTLIHQAHAVELREITVTADAGLDTQFIEAFQYNVVNLSAV